MSNKYQFIICTYACPLASTSATGEIICIHYQPMWNDYVVAKLKSNSERGDQSPPVALPDLLPIVPWQPWYQAPSTSNGVLCLEPREREPGNQN